MVDRWNTLVTGSVDGAVRLWTLQGQYIGNANKLMPVKIVLEPSRFARSYSFYGTKNVDTLIFQLLL